MKAYSKSAQTGYLALFTRTWMTQHCWLSRHSYGVENQCAVAPLLLRVRIGDKWVCNLVNSMKMCIAHFTIAIFIVHKREKKHLNGKFRLFCFVLQTVKPIAHVRCNAIAIMSRTTFTILQCFNVSLLAPI